MRITITGKHMELTDSLKAYAEKKMNKLEKYFSHIQEVQIRQSVVRQWHVAEVMVQGDGILLRGEERSADMYASIDQVFEKLERQLQKFKGKRSMRPREETAHLRDQIDESTAGELSEEAPAEAASPTAPLEQIRIVRTKHFAFKPMTPEEAALQMELVGHDFFVFANADTGQVNVIYRRKGGNYGLIEPEV